MRTNAARTGRTRNAFHRQWKSSDCPHIATAMSWNTLAVSLDVTF